MSDWVYNAISSSLSRHVLCCPHLLFPGRGGVICTSLLCEKKRQGSDIQAQPRNELYHPSLATRYAGFGEYKDGRLEISRPITRGNFCPIRIAGSRSAMHRVFKHAHLDTMTPSLSHQGNNTSCRNFYFTVAWLVCDVHKPSPSLSPYFKLSPYSKSHILRYWIPSQDTTCDLFIAISESVACQLKYHILGPILHTTSTSPHLASVTPRSSPFLVPGYYS
ncbi:hypothetical protein BJV77DRAFT_159242 [Russula vinacea]|nr:hypothetical protein BJV77DRAFT_159242 [Russula vinacea]